MKERVEQQAFETQLRIESGEQPIVGVNSFVDEGEQIEPELQRIDPQSEQRQVDRLRAHRASRDQERSSARSPRCAGRAEDDDPPLRAAPGGAEAGATVGETCGTLRARLGDVRRGARRARLGRPASALRRVVLELLEDPPVGREPLGLDPRRARHRAAVLPLVVQARAPAALADTAAISGNASCSSSGVTSAIPKLRTPAVSISSPPPGRSIRRATVVVWRPRPITSLIAPVGSARPVSEFESVVFPTPEWPREHGATPADQRAHLLDALAARDRHRNDRVAEPAQERRDALHLLLVVREVDLRQCERRFDPAAPGGDQVAVEQVRAQRRVRRGGDDDQQVDVRGDHLRPAAERRAREGPRRSWISSIRSEPSGVVWMRTTSPTTGRVRRSRPAIVATPSPVAVRTAANWLCTASTVARSPSIPLGGYAEATACAADRPGRRYASGRSFGRRRERRAAEAAVPSRVSAAATTSSRRRRVRRARSPRQ